MPQHQIRTVSLPCIGLETLMLEASAQGFAFLDRLAAEWESGRNQFDRPGECLIGAYVGEHLVGVCGLSRDPYIETGDVGGLSRDPYIEAGDVGRLRHLYMLSAYRGCGIGSGMVEHLLRHATGAFRAVRLRTDNERAARFYTRHGFRAIADPTATHIRAV
jgi:GNAT superfamily N-acetyltransferase